MKIWQVQPKKFSRWIQVITALILACSFSFSAGIDPAQAARRVKPPLAPALPLSGPFTLHVNQDGVYRVTHEEMVAAGLNLNRVNPRDIAITLQGTSVPLFVNSGRTFGPGSYIEFYGQALDTLYTKTNVYQIQVDRRLASRINTLNTLTSAAEPAIYYMEKIVHNENYAYEVASPISDPWYHTKLLAFTQPLSWSFAIDLENYLPDAAPVSLEVAVYGAADVYQSPDHHIRAQFNGQTVADTYFDGYTAQTLTASDLPAVPGTNILELTLPADAGLSFDMVHLESYQVSYPRAFIARQGRLQFTAAGQVFKISGLDDANIIVYRLENDLPVRISGLAVNREDGSYSASFSGASEPTTYWVSTEESLLHPVIQAGRPVLDIANGRADYLIISHPNFLNSLGALALARQAQGYTVKIVNVDDVYDQFNYGVFDPKAIRSYIGHAKNNMGTQYVLLVGGDSYDYHNYLGLGNNSYIPTLYAATDQYARYSPADPLFSDVDNDNIPDLALGRFPVRDNDQLSAIIAKTLAYENKSYHNTSVFSSDLRFSKYSDAWAATLPPEWSKQFANLDQMAAAEGA